MASGLAQATPILDCTMSQARYPPLRKRFQIEDIPVINLPSALYNVTSETITMWYAITICGMFIMQTLSIAVCCVLAR